MITRVFIGYILMIQLSLQLSLHSLKLSSKKLVSLRSSLRMMNSLVIQCDNEEEMETFGLQLGEYCSTGDVILLRGGLGAGKTCISRGIIRSKLNDYTMKVTSPTYLLDNAYLYDDNQFIHHFDLYRMPSNCDMSVLNIPQVYHTSLCLIEWPQRLSPQNMPTSCLDIDITIDKEPSCSRRIKLSPHGEKWEEKLGQFKMDMEAEP